MSINEKGTKYNIPSYKKERKKFYLGEMDPYPIRLEKGQTTKNERQVFGELLVEFFRENIVELPPHESIEFKTFLDTEYMVTKERRLCFLPHKNIEYEGIIEYRDDIVKIIINQHKRYNFGEIFENYIKDNLNDIYKKNIKSPPIKVIFEEKREP